MAGVRLRNPVEDHTESPAEAEEDRHEDREHNNMSHAEVVVHRRACGEAEEVRVHHRQPCNEGAWE